MFSKTSDPTAAPPRPSSGTNASRSVLGTDLRITGEISAGGAIEIHGEIDGNLTADSVMVGQDGRLSGSVRAQSVEVKGRLDGKVESGSFSLRATAQVAADVVYTTLVIESGAQIEGRFTRPKV